MNVHTVNLVLESNVLRCSRNEFRLTYDLAENRQVVIARSEKHALTIGHGVCGVGMVWVNDEEAKGMPGYEEALRLAEDADPHLRTVQIDVRCPDEVWTALEGMADQAAKGQWWNALLRAMEFAQECARRFGDVLKG